MSLPPAALEVEKKSALPIEVAVASDPELRARGLLAIARRSIPGTAFPGLAYGVVGLLAGSHRVHPFLYTLGAVSWLLIAAGRLRLTLAAERLIAADAERWARWFRRAVLASLLVWTLSVTAIVLRIGLTPVAFLGMIASAGLAGAGLHVFCADPKLAWGFIVVLLVPPAAAVAIIQEPVAPWLVASVGLFALYQFAESRALYEEFWGGVLAVLQAERQAAELETAHGQLDRSRLQLEDEVRSRTLELVVANRLLAEDIEQRREVEGRLRQRQEDYQHIFEQAHDPILVFSPQDEVILNANQRACEVYGYSREELIGRSITAFSADPAGGRAELGKTLREGKYHNFETRQFTRDGRTLHLDVNASVIQYEGETAILSINRDVTERKEAEKLRLEKEAAEQANQAKSAFLANLSHELRTPLAGVIGLADMLYDQPLAASVQEQVATLRERSRSLLQLIDDILDFSQAEAGRIALELRPFSPASLAREVLDLLATEAGRKGLALELGLDAALPAALVGDPARLRQVLLNLLGNAVKFTTSGSVTLRVGPGEASGEAYTSRWTVEDTGPGIPAEYCERVFEPFFQVDSSTSRAHGGTGLGLAICQRMVAAMGGTLHLESTPGHGSRFAVELALARFDDAETPHRDGQPVAGRRGARLLLAEDNELNQLVTLYQLEALGYSARAVSNGREALAALAQEAFDLVLMDCQMPEVDGYEATRRLRETYGSRLPVVAITAHTRRADRERCFAAGMNDFLSKPFEVAELAAIIARHLSDPATTTSVS